LVRANLDAMNSRARQEMNIKTREILLAEFKEGIWTAEQYREQIALLNGDEAPHRAAKKARKYSPDWDEDLDF